MLPDEPPTESLGEIRCLDHGYLALVSTFGQDRDPARIARTSFRNKKVRSLEDDTRLTKYLLRHGHSEPFEFVNARFYFKAPITVCRQIFRHRTAKKNEISYRYMQASREFYVPALERMQKQSESKKQGSSDELIADPAGAHERMRRICNLAFDEYEALLADGLAAEIARGVLPMHTYTEWYWQNDIHNLLDMLGKRLAGDAQGETRVYARAMLDLLEPVYPIIIGAWKELHRG
jgi:thymidylate synthase (FAD)